MLNYDDIYKSLVTVIESITSATCIIANQNAPRPTGEYSTIKIISQSRVGWESITMVDQAGPDVDLIETIEGQQNLLLSLNFFRGQAQQVANNLKLLIQTSGYHELLTVAGLGVGLISPVRDIPDVLSKSWEERAQLDINFNAVDSGIVITRSILTATITGTVENRGIEFPVEINV